MSRGEEEAQEGGVRKSAQALRIHLEDVVSRFHICDVDPLAVDLGVVRVVTSWTQALHRGHPPAGYPHFMEDKTTLASQPVLLAGNVETWVCAVQAKRL